MNKKDIKKLAKKLSGIGKEEVKVVVITQRRGKKERTDKR